MTDLLKLFGDLKKEQQEVISDINGRVLICDGYNSFLRCFAATPTLNDDGNHIGGVSGFLKSLGLVIRTFRPSRVVIAFDGKGGSQRRRKLFPEYKENRRTMTRLNRTYDFKDVAEEQDAVKQQLFGLAHLLKALPVTVLSPPNVEADDVIAYITQVVAERNGKSIIMSTDKDFLQLVSERTSVWNPIKHKLYELPAVLDEYHIHPTNFALYRALDGDASDNIPGVKGVGYKTLVKFFPQLEAPTKLTVDELVAFASDQALKHKKTKIFSKVAAASDLIKRNYGLMQLDVSVMAGATQLDVIDRLDKNPVVLDKLVFTTLLRESKMYSVFGDLNGWLLTTFVPLTRFTLSA